MMKACVQLIYMRGLKCSNVDNKKIAQLPEVAQWLHRDIIASWKPRDDTAQPVSAMRDYISHIKAYYEGLTYPRDLAASWR